jgi:hypothetical protein
MTNKVNLLGTRNQLPVLQVMGFASATQSLYSSRNMLQSVAYREGVWGVQPPPPKFRSFDKAEPNSQFRGKYISNNLIRIRVSLICKLSGTTD